VLAHTACARHQPTPPKHVKQGRQPTLLPHRAMGPDKSPVGNSPRANPHPPQQSSGRTQIAPRKSARGRMHRRRNDTRRASAATCGQSQQRKPSQDGYQSYLASNQDYAASHGSSSWTADRGAIVQLHGGSMMQSRRSPTGVSTARRACLSRPLGRIQQCSQQPNRTATCGKRVAGLLAFQPPSQN